MMWVDTMLGDGGALVLVAAPESSEWYQENPHSLTKKYRGSCSEGLAVISFVIDNEVNIAVKCRMVCPNVFNVS